MKLTERYRERFERTLRDLPGRAVGYRVDRVRLPNGRTAERQFLTHPGAVGVLAFETPRKILLVKQFRYPVREFTYEIPAGKLAAGEDPSACVRRELEEEAGFQAGRLKKLIAYWPTPAFSDEVLHLYLAEDLIATHVHPDEDEFLELARVSPGRMERMIRSGQIKDSKTVIAYFLWKNRRFEYQRSKSTRSIP